jgi:hypothetical protein
MPAEASAAPVCAPVTADTRRHTATSDDIESGAYLHVETFPDTTRHAGLGLHNRRVQGRFLSRLPRIQAASNHFRQAPQVILSPKSSKTRSIFLRLLQARGGHPLTTKMADVLPPIAWLHVVAIPGC